MAFETVGVRVVLLGLEAYQRATGQFVASNTAMGRSVGNLGRSVGSIGRGVSKVGRAVGSVGTALTIGVTLPAALAATAVIKSGSDIEQSFVGVTKTVEGLSEVTEDGSVRITRAGEAVKQAFRDLALSRPTPLTDLFEIAEFAGQLGIASDEAETLQKVIAAYGEDSNATDIAARNLAEALTDFSEVSADLDISTNLNLEDATLGMARFMDIMNVSTDTARNQGDVITFLGNNYSVLEDQILAAAVRLAPTTSLIGATTQDTLALAAALGASGVKVEAGTTAATTVLQEMGKAISGVNGNLGAFARITFPDSENAAREFAETFRNNPIEAFSLFEAGIARVNAEGENLDPILSDLGLGSKRTSLTVKALANVSDVFSDALGNVNDEHRINNALSDEAARRNDTLAGAFQQLKNELIDIGLTFKDEVDPFLKSFIRDTLIPLIRKFKNLSPEIKRFVLLGLGIAAALGPALIILGTLLGVVGSLISTFGALIGTVGLVLGFVTSLFSSLGLAAAPIAALVLGIGLLIGAFLGLIAVANFDTIKEQLSSLGTTLRDVGKPILVKLEELKDKLMTFIGDFLDDAIPRLEETFGPIIEDIGQFARDLIEETIGPAIEDAIDEIITFIDENGDNIKQTFDNLLTTIEELWDAFGADILNIISAAFLSIINLFRTIFKIILGIAKIFFAVFAGDWSTAWEGVKDILNAAFNGTKEQLSIYLDLFIELFDDAWEVIKTQVSIAWAAIRNEISKAWEKIKTIIGNAINQLKINLFLEWELIKAIFALAWEKIKGFFSKAFESITAAIGTFFTDVKESFTEIKDTITSTISDGINKVKEFFEGLGPTIIDTLTSVIPDLVQAGIDLMAGLAQGLKDGAGAVFAAVADIARNIVSTLLSNLVGSPVLFTFHVGEDLASDLGEGFSKDITPIVKGMATEVSTPFNTIMGGTNMFATAPASQVQVVPVPVDKMVLNVDSTFTSSEESPGALAQSLQGLINANR